MFKIKFFFTVYPEKIAKLLYSYSALLLATCPFSVSSVQLSSSSLLLCSPQLISTSPLTPSPVACSSIFLSSAQHFFCALSSPLGSLSSFHLSDLSCGSRGLIYSPNILNCTCAHARKEKPTHIFHRLPDLNVIWATFNLSESKRELCPTSQPACVQQIWI